jgi:ribosomal protein S18 acetylase RimI-like enzyme
MTDPQVTYEWRGAFGNPEINALHAQGFDNPQVRDDDWRGQVDRHSLGWVCARAGGELVGFVNVAWDGGTHFFLLDTTVAPSHRHRGIGRRLVAGAVELSRQRGGDWLHVDHDDELTPFYADCGFRPTAAGLIQLYDD